MDYSSFVKNCYSYIMKKLNEFDSYNGSRAIVNYLPNTPKEYVILNENLNNTFLPSVILVANTPSNIIEDFLDFYATTQPDLSSVYLGRNGLRKLFSLMLENKIDEDKQFDFITSYFDISIEVLKKEGILAYAN